MGEEMRKNEKKYRGEEAKLINVLEEKKLEIERKKLEADEIFVLQSLAQTKDAIAQVTQQQATYNRHYDRDDQKDHIASMKRRQEQMEKKLEQVQNELKSWKTQRKDPKQKQGESNIFNDIAKSVKSFV